MSNEIRQNEWRDFLKDFSRGHKRWNAKIEVFSTEIGDHVLIDGLPLNGISIEKQGSDLFVNISVGTDRGSHQMHTIKNPIAIAFLPNHKELQESLSIEEESGTRTLVTLNDTRPTSRGYFREYDTVVNSRGSGEFPSFVGSERAIL